MYRNSKNEEENNKIFDIMSKYYKKKIGYDDAITDMKILFNNGMCFAYLLYL